jgi:hypothetical protein
MNQSGNATEKGPQGIYEKEIQRVHEDPVMAGGSLKHIFHCARRIEFKQHIIVGIGMGYGTLQKLTEHDVK